MAYQVDGKGGEYILKIPFFSRSKQSARSPDNPSSPASAVTVKTQQYEQSWMPFAYLPRKYEQRMGVTRGLDVSLFKYYPLNDILDILRNNHPETSFAIWQFLRVANSGITCKAKTVAGKDYKHGQDVLDQKILWNLNHPPNSGKFEQARGLELISGQLMLNAMLRGGAGCENVLNQAGKLDRIQPFDAGTIYFQSDGNSNRLIPFQKQTIPGTGYVNVDFPTIFYQPLDPSTDDPYGSPPLASLIQIVVFQIQFMNDLMAAVHRVGYPRMTGSLVEEAFREQLPETTKMDPEAYQRAADNYLRATQDTLRNLNPDDYLVGWDTLKMDILGKGGSSTIKVDAVIAVINKSLSAALKTLSSIIGIGENTSKESYAAELKLYSRGIESVQKVVENLLERALTMALNLEGVQGWVDVSFAPVDLRSELQVVAEMQTKQDIITFARDCGDINDLEQSNLIRNMLGLVGLPKEWKEMKALAQKKREEGGLEANRHGSPPATQ